MLASHQGEEAKFSTTILDQQKYNMQRYIAESLHIEVTTNDRETIVMNSKSEWGRQKLTRIRVVDNT